MEESNFYYLASSVSDRLFLVLKQDDLTNRFTSRIDGAEALPKISIPMFYIHQGDQKLNY